MWLKGVRACSATTTKPGEAEEAGAGWINAKAIAGGSAKLFRKLRGQPFAEEQTTESRGEQGTNQIPCSSFTTCPQRGPRGELSQPHPGTWAAFPLQAFGGNKVLTSVSVVLMQEIIRSRQAFCHQQVVDTSLW